MNLADASPKINSIGVKFKIDVGEDVTEATTAQLHFLKPDGTVVIVDATVEDDVYLSYTTTTDDDGDGNTLLNQAGRWTVVAYVVLTDFTGYGDSCIFDVEGTY